jgi:hypothetical protein
MDEPYRLNQKVKKKHFAAAVLQNMLYPATECGSSQPVFSDISLDKELV